MQWSYLKKWIRSRLSGFWKIGVRGNNNVLENRGSTNGVRYDIAGHNNRVVIERGAVLENVTIYMRGNGHRLLLEEGCRISGGSIWFEDSDCRIEIGRKTTIESAHLAVTEPGRSILIGEDCMFAHNIQIRTGDSHSILQQESGERINFAQDVVLGAHVWLGENVTVLKGVHIGKHSIVAFGSIMTKDLPAHCLAAGMPARVVKQGIDWKRERIPQINELPVREPR